MLLLAWHTRTQYGREGSVLGRCSGGYADDEMLSFLSEPDCMSLAEGLAFFRFTPAFYSQHASDIARGACEREILLGGSGFPEHITWHG